jgi:hypothetical protein
MSKEQGLFTVAEDEKLEREIISVAEGELGLPEGSMPQAEPAYRVETPQQAADPVSEDDKGYRETKDVKRFMEFLKSEMARIPPFETARGTQSLMERSLGQWKALDGHCSQALRGDYEGTLDVDAMDKARKFIETTIDALEDALHALSETKRSRKKQRRRRGDADFDLTKEATAPHFSGFQMVITPFQRAIVGSLINGKVSGGRNMEELYVEAAKKYKLNDREELEILAILADFGYPIFKDRLRLGDDQDPSRAEGFGEWQSQYTA